MHTWVFLNETVSPSNNKKHNTTNDCQPTSLSCFVSVICLSTQACVIMFDETVPTSGNMSKTMSIVMNQHFWVFVSIYDCLIKHASVCLIMKVSPTTQTSYLLVVQSKVSIVDFQYVFQSMLLYCCACACVEHIVRLFNNCNQFLQNFKWMSTILYFRHAHLTMTLFDHQQDCQSTQINLNNYQLKTNQSIECSSACQSTSMAKHWVFAMIIQWRKLHVFEVVLIENRKNSCRIK